MESKTYDGLLRFTREELARECQRRGLVCNLEKAEKHELLGRILEDNLSPPKPADQDAENVSATDLLRLVHRMLEQQANKPNRLISTPELSHTLPIFGGKDEDTLSEWLSVVEAMRLQYKWEDPTALAIAQNKLQGAAKDWNESVGRRLLTWKDWTVELKKQFGYDVTVLTWSKRCEDRIQGLEEKITDYMHAKMKLIEKCPVKLRERDKVDYLVLGVRNKAISASLLSHYKSAACDCYSLIELARELEPRSIDPFHDSDTRRPHDKFYTQKQDSRGTDRAYMEYERSQRRGSATNSGIQRCFRCNATGHLSYDHDDPIKARNLPPVINPLPNVKKPDHRDERDRKHLGTCAAVFGKEFASKHPSRPVLAGKIGDDYEVDLLIDTGADVTILRESDAKSLRIPIQKWTKKAMDVVGTELMPKGTAEIRITIGNTSAVVEAAIVDQVPYAVLVGGDWREAAHCGISIGPGRRVILEPTDNVTSPKILASLFLTKESPTETDRNYDQGGRGENACHQHGCNLRDRYPRDFEQRTQSRVEIDTLKERPRLNLKSQTVAKEPIDYGILATSCIVGGTTTAAHEKAIENKLVKENNQHDSSTSDDRIRKLESYQEKLGRSPGPCQSSESSPPSNFRNSLTEGDKMLSANAWTSEGQRQFNSRSQHRTKSDSWSKDSLCKSCGTRPGSGCARMRDHDWNGCHESRQTNGSLLQQSAFRRARFKDPRLIYEEQELLEGISLLRLFPEAFYHPFSGRRSESLSKRPAQRTSSSGRVIHTPKRFEDYTSDFDENL